MSVQHRYKISPGGGISWWIHMYQPKGDKLVYSGYIQNQWLNGEWQTVEVYDNLNKEVILVDAS